MPLSDAEPRASSTREREDAAADRAFRRGQESGRLDNHISEDNRQFGEIRKALADNASRTTKVGEGLSTLKASFDKYVTEAETRSAVAVELAAKQLSAKQFYVGLVTAVGALAGILAAVGHA